MKRTNSKRSLTVSSGYHRNCQEPHPYIRLKGIYLNKLGFKIGETVELRMEPGRIIISNTSANNQLRLIFD